MKPDHRPERKSLIYRPLGVDRQEIRLVEFVIGDQEADQEGVTSFRLRYASLADTKTPEYIALSYAWGTGRGSVMIYDEEDRLQEIEISTNLIEGLHPITSRLSNEARQACLEESSPPLFWIDQLCINQSDIVEKSQQVRLMRAKTDIYSRATKVCVWLGAASANSRVGVSVMEKLAFMTTDLFRELGTGMSSWNVESDDSSVSRNIDKILTQLCSNDFEELQAIDALCDRAWFHRAWVIQEVVVAGIEKIEVSFAEGTWEWSTLVNASMALTFLVRRLRAQRRQYPPTVLRLLLKISTNIDLTVYQTILRVKGSSGSMAGIIQALLLMRKLQATLPQDLVYSMMGIADDGKTCGIEIDYAKPYTRVFAETALMLLGSKGADTLAWCSQIDPELPSWVPDLRVQPEPTIQGLYDGNSPDSRLFNASGSQAFEYSVDNGRTTLSLFGAYIGVVVDFTKSFELPPGEMEFELPFIRGWLKNLTHFVSARTQTAEVSTRYTPHQVEDLLWRLPIADRYFVNAKYARANPSLKALYAAIVEPEVIEEEAAAVEIWKFTYALYLHRKKAFITDTGFIGVCPAKSKKGDLLYLIRGSDVPFLMRKVNGNFQLVGEVYVHGIMDGELSSDDLSFDELNIH